jgi:hypothetical protein
MMVCIPAVNMIGNNVVNQSESFGFLSWGVLIFLASTLREKVKELIYWSAINFL